MKGLRADFVLGLYSDAELSERQAAFERADTIPCPPPLHTLSNEAQPVYTEELVEDLVLAISRVLEEAAPPVQASPNHSDEWLVFGRSVP